MLGVLFSLYIQRSKGLHPLYFFYIMVVDCSAKVPQLGTFYHFCHSPDAAAPMQYTTISVAAAAPDAASYPAGVLAVVVYHRLRFPYYWRLRFCPAPSVGGLFWCKHCKQCNWGKQCLQCVPHPLLPYPAYPSVPPPLHPYPTYPTLFSGFCSYPIHVTPAAFGWYFPFPYTPLVWRGYYCQKKNTAAGGLGILWGISK